MEPPTREEEWVKKDESLVRCYVSVSSPPNTPNPNPSPANTVSEEKRGGERKGGREGGGGKLIRDEPG